MKYRQSLKHRLRMTMIDIRHRIYMTRIKHRIIRRWIHIKYGFLSWFCIMSSTRGRVAFRAFGIAFFVYYDGMHKWRKPRVSKVSSGKHVSLGRISMIL